MFLLVVADHSLSLKSLNGQSKMSLLARYRPVSGHTGILMYSSSPRDKMFDVIIISILYVSIIGYNIIYKRNNPLCLFAVYVCVHKVS